MMRTSRTPTITQAPLGATLVEVLMSLLIMSIGIVSVFSLFPISIVSSIRATQLTNGKILKDNVEQLVHVIPELMVPPFGATWGDAGTWKSSWSPSTNYTAGDIIIPTLQPGKLFPSPYYALRCTATGISGTTEPIWDTTTTTYTETASGPAAWQVLQLPNYVIDPVGYYRSLVGMNMLFGNRDALSETNSYLNQLPRRSPSPATSERFAVNLFSSPDSWSVIFQDSPLSISTDGLSVTFPPSISVDNVSTDPYLSRVVLSTPDGTKSLIRTPTAASGGSVLVLNQPVPTSFTGMARLESFSSRYSYFLTVQNNGVASPPTISCAVVFNRQLSADSEHAYKANFGNPNFTSDSSVTYSSLQSNQVRISWGGTNEPEPFLKAGSYVIDLKALVFYRIVDVSKSGTTATITLNRPVEALTRNNAGGNAGLAVMMPGTLHVYYVQ